MKMKKYKLDKGTAVKASLAILILIGAVVYSVYTLNKFNSGLPREQAAVSAGSSGDSSYQAGGSTIKPGTSSVQMIPISEEERKEIREEFIRELDLTPEQLKVAKKYEKKGPPKDLEEAKVRMKVLRETLTPEQQKIFWQKMREVRDERIASRKEKAKQTLPPDQYEIFEERLEDRINQFREALSERRGEWKQIAPEDVPKE
jgi:hypothetical protein